MRHARGFTLLEVVVALVVMGFLFVSLTQGVSLELAFWRGQSRLTGPEGDLDTVDRAVRRLIGHMDPGLPLQPPLLQAQAHTLAFTTELPEAAGPLARAAADVSLGVDARRRLVLRWRPHFPGGETDAPAELELLRGVDHVDFAYWRDGAWATQWNDAESLPALVRVTLSFKPKRDWPPILAATMREQPQ